MSHWPTAEVRYVECVVVNVVVVGIDAGDAVAGCHQQRYLEKAAIVGAVVENHRLYFLQFLFVSLLDLGVDVRSVQQPNGKWERVKKMYLGK